VVRFDQPIVAAVDRPASGAGLCTVLLADIKAPSALARRSIGVSMATGRFGVDQQRRSTGRARAFCRSSTGAWPSPTSIGLRSLHGGGSGSLIACR
jgi:hypothetical protein